MNIVLPPHIYQRIQKAGEHIGVGVDEAIELIAMYGIWPDDLLDIPQAYPEYAELVAYLTCGEVDDE
jgi:hypothetical protein